VHFSGSCSGPRRTRDGPGLYHIPAPGFGPSHRRVLHSTTNKCAPPTLALAGPAQPPHSLPQPGAKFCHAQRLVEMQPHMISSRPVAFNTTTLISCHARSHLINPSIFHAPPRPRAPARCLVLRPGSSAPPFFPAPAPWLRCLRHGFLPRIPHTRRTANPPPTTTTHRPTCRPRDPSNLPASKRARHGPHSSTGPHPPCPNRIGPGALVDPLPPCIQPGLPPRTTPLSSRAHARAGPLPVGYHSPPGRGRAAPGAPAD
jgi:hypothetical protein